MAISNSVQMQAYSGTLLALNLLSGSSNTLVLSNVGTVSRAVLTENSNQLLVGEVVSLGGRQVQVLGSGTVQGGIRLLGATIPLDAKYPMVLVKDVLNGKLSFVYPQGVPSGANVIAMVVTARPVGYTFPGGVLCFAHGTLIATPRGPRAVEDLRIGQRVITVDRGPRPIKWLLHRHLDAADLTERPNLRPVRIPAGALGGAGYAGARPARDLMVSPQHRILIDSPVAAQMFGKAQVLVAALHLVGFAGIAVAHPPEGIRYTHVILDRHALLWADGAVAESFFTGPEAMRGLEPQARQEVARLGLGDMSPVRMLLKKPQTRALVAAIVQQGRVLQPAMDLDDLMGEDGAVRED